jgi:hypothetical protein
MDLNSMHILHHAAEEAVFGPGSIEQHYRLGQ